jgi:hypothetical protein
MRRWNATLCADGGLIIAKITAEKNLKNSYDLYFFLFSLAFFAIQTVQTEFLYAKFLSRKKGI